MAKNKPFIRNSRFSLCPRLIFDGAIRQYIRRRRWTMERNILTNAKDFFERIINLIPLGLALGSQRNDIEFHNNRFAEIFGQSSHKITSLVQWLSIAFPENDYRRQVRGILFFEIPYTQTDNKRIFTATVTTDNGMEKLVEFTSLKLDQDNFLFICEDVTEKRKKEEQFYQAQKMEAVGAIAGGLAHEVNNILMGIQGYVSLMMLDTPPSHHNYARLQAIETQVKSGADLTEQLLEEARGGRFELKTIDLNDFIDDVTVSFRQTHDELQITEKLSTYIWAVEADLMRLEQAFQNILVNAAKLLPRDGILSLTTDNIMLDERFSVPHGIKSGPYARVSLMLPGILMDDETVKTLFSPSYVLKSSGESRPDLSFAYGMIKGHGGTLEVESHPSAGTVFHVYLPASAKSPHKKKLHVPSAKPRATQETILLVDDEKVITDVTGAMLRALGYRVIVASDGEEALAVYQIQGQSIDLIIMDVVMPGMGGGEAIDLIRSINPFAKVILCSGYSMDGAIKTIMDKGVQAFLKKPFRLKDISNKIRDVLDG